MNWRSLIGLFGTATLVALAFRMFVVEDFRITSDSMAPGLVPGDLVFVSKSAFNLHLPFSTYELIRFRPPMRGEVVAFSLPERGFDTFVKRIAALENDRIHIKKGALYINGTQADYLKNPDGSLVEKIGGVTYPIQNEMTPTRDYGPVDIPKNHFFALGDNRMASIDSRNWGPVPYSCLKGRVSVVWLSLGSEGLRRERFGVWVR